MQKFIIWALFDSEHCTVAKALPEHEVYSFGIGSGKEHIELDLSDYNSAKKELDKYPKPDIIFASPPCESWVQVSGHQVLRYGIEVKDVFNLHWRNRWTPLDLEQRYKETRINGINTALATAKIILHYKPKYFCIENGSSSWIFDYIEQHSKLIGIRNICLYGSYGYDFRKRTIIYSNLYMPLRASIKGSEKEYPNLKLMGGSNKYSYRSRVPEALYRHIISFMQNPQGLRYIYYAS